MYVLQPKRCSLRHRLPGADEGFLSFVGDLLQTDPALVEKMLIPVRKRRQAKTADPSLPPEVRFLVRGVHQLSPT